MTEDSVQEPFDAVVEVDAEASLKQEEAAAEEFLKTGRQIQETIKSSIIQDNRRYRRLNTFLLLILSLGIGFQVFNSVRNRPVLNRIDANTQELQKANLSIDAANRALDALTSFVDQAKAQQGSSASATTEALAQIGQIRFLICQTVDPVQVKACRNAEKAEAAAKAKVASTSTTTTGTTITTVPGNPVTLVPPVSTTGTAKAKKTHLLCIGSFCIG